MGWFECTCLPKQKLAELWPQPDKKLYSNNKCNWWQRSRFKDHDSLRTVYKLVTGYFHIAPSKIEKGEAEIHWWAKWAPVSMDSNWSWFFVCPVQMMRPTWVDRYPCDSIILNDSLIRTRYITHLISQLILIRLWVVSVK